MEQVLPQALRGRKDLVRIKRSQGEDLIEFLWNGSQIHFVGLDDPGRVFSAEFGAAMFDEAHEISEEDVMTVNTRLRQRCQLCLAKNEPDCAHMPRRMVFAFNPSFPGHWLHEWFIQAATPTEHGSYKAAVVPKDADHPIGDAEFFRARAPDNPFLPGDYITRNLAGLSRPMRQRYLEGRWLHISGHGFFDEEAIAGLQEGSETLRPFLGETKGALTGDNKDDRPRIVEHKEGRLHVFRPPVRWSVDERTGNEQKAHRYVIGVDTSSGAAADYSGIQVLDIDTFEQAAEWQGKIDPDTLAEIAFTLACVYNGALLAPEVTGGWGFAVVKRIQKLGTAWNGPVESKPKLYLRPQRGRLADKFTDLLGWDTGTMSRALMLSTLEALIREGGITVHGSRTIAELAAFAFPQAKPGMDYRPPRAQPGQHDDLVIPLAIAATVASRSPRQAARPPRREDPPSFAAAGY